MPDGSYQQVQDNREWSWKTFHWMFIAPLQGDRSGARLRVSVGVAEGGVKSVVLVDELGQDRQQEKYKTLEALNPAWGLQAASFDQLHDAGLAVKTRSAESDMKDYEALFFEESHKLIRDTFRKHDRNHMLLGDRWQPQTANNERLCAIVGTYCEIVSVNYYTYGVDKEYLQRIHRWTGSRPLFLSEFHWCCPGESGLSGGKEVASQQERGLAYRNYVEKAAVAPRAPGSIRLDGTMKGWPGNPPETIPGRRAVEGAAAEGLEAAFRVCWDDGALYLLADVEDATPMQNPHAGDRLWSADGLEVFIGSEQLDQPGGLLSTDRQILLGAAKPDGQCRWFVCRAADQPRIAMEVVPGVDGKSYTLEAAIPWSVIGVKPEPGRELLFDLAVDDSLDGKARRCQLMWNGSAKNSGDRTHWGRLRLNP